MTRPIAIIKTGRTVPAVAARRGDFERWFAEGTGLEPSALQVFDVFRDIAPPPPSELAAIIVTGSAAMVSARETWSERTAEWLRRAVEQHKPILAVCYGHQLLAHALGAPVGPSPRGREIGTVHLDLRDEARTDPLFSQLPRSLRVQATHSESVLELPDGAQWLASNEHDPYQAYRVGDRAWAVQFHPEFDADIIRGYIEARRDALADEGFDPEALIAQVGDSEHGTQLLRRFVKLLRWE